ncbi:hypothetical protein FRB94_007499 [Tulasnella sp. JGI-2019a]|nr:hypothetical protein FRB94_007499 [Tulasnella sp. JGI-2019a]
MDPHYPAARMRAQVAESHVFFATEALMDYRALMRERILTKRKMVHCIIDLKVLSLYLLTPTFSSEKDQGIARFRRLLNNKANPHFQYLIQRRRARGYARGYTRGLQGQKHNFGGDQPMPVCALAEKGSIGVY